MDSLLDLREFFPILHQKMRGKPLVYLDTAATALKPAAMTESMSNYYHEYCANIHRGVYEYSERSSAAYEEVREKIRSFFSLPDTMEVIFTTGTTDGINFIASSLTLSPGDEIVLSEMEHHSNLLPWQKMSESTGSKLVFIPISADGHIEVEEACRLLSPRTRVCAITGMSNVTGYIPQLAPFIEQSRRLGVRIIIDGAQLAAHTAIDLSQLTPDVFVCSAHKLYGPTGVGILCASGDLLKTIPPRQLGGGMVVKVQKNRSVWADIPQRFEGGTPHIAGVIGMGKSIDFLQQTGMQAVSAHEQALYTYFVELLSTIEGIRILGKNNYCTAVCSFVVDKVHAHDIGTLLDQWGIAVRTGHHCAQPFLESLGVRSTARVSFGIYNTAEEVEFCIKALKEILKILR